MLQKIALQPEVDDRIATSFLRKTILVVKNDATRNWSFSQLLPLKSHHYLVILSKPFSVDELLRIMIRVELSAAK